MKRSNMTKMAALSRSLIEIVWQFGPKGVDGICCVDLSMPEYLALEAAAKNDDCPVQHIGMTLGFTKSGATRIVNRLEKKGYINKCKSIDDARICCVVPTDAGVEVLEDVSKRYVSRLTAILEKESNEDAENIAHALVKLASSLRR